MMCYRREKLENSAEKPIYSPTNRNNRLANQLEYMNTQNPSKPKLSKVLEPSELQLSIVFTVSCFC